MKKSDELRAFYQANVACGDICEAAAARLKAEIIAAEQEEEEDSTPICKRAFARAA